MVTLLGTGQPRQSARVKNASGRGLAIEMNGPVAPGTALKIELADAIVLGEAVYCRPGTEAHLVGVELDQVLCGLSELGRRLQELAGTGSLEPQVSYALNKREGQDRQQPQK
jgi:hypothetical protein